ncbi:MAG: phytanoyl-CoA dioxygenase family protein, partial [Kordiimonas sp.]
MVSIFEVLSRKKSFDNKWIGNQFLNKTGLHLFRIALADTFLKLRRLQSFGTHEHYKDFKRDGIVAIPNFLPDDQFIRLQNEARTSFHMAAAENPIDTSNTNFGFGQKQQIKGGYDRLDGGTTNRFLKISEQNHPECTAFIQDPRLVSLYNKAAGAKTHPEKFWLYQITHGDEECAPDIQKALHRDTFHSAIKLWYFVEDVLPEHGPLEYIPGSHKMDERRKRWEYIKSTRISSGKKSRYKGGAFRASDADLRYMRLESPKAFPVKANTLVLADIRGFHRRGQASTSSDRYSIYA